METVRKILVRFVFPPIWLVVVLAPIATAFLIYVFVGDGVSNIMSYCAYFLSAYALTIVCTRAVEIYRAIMNFRKNNKYVTLYMEDSGVRVKVSLYVSVVMNMIYAVFQLALGIYHSSVWFYALMAYYSCLVLIRFFLLNYIRCRKIGEDIKSELRRYRFCGWVLVCINLALSVIVFYIAWQNKSFEHHAITTIAMAAYTFASLAIAIVNVVKYKKYNSPIISASKIISLAAASVSVLTLEAAMLTAFGKEGQEVFRQVVTSLTGMAVCIFVLVLAVFMLWKANRDTKNIAN